MIDLRGERERRTDQKRLVERVGRSGTGADAGCLLDDPQPLHFAPLDTGQALVNILQEKLGKKMFVIILSAQKDATIALELLKHKAFAYQSKPLDFQKLLVDVSRAITTLVLP